MGKKIIIVLSSLIILFVALYFSSGKFRTYVLIKRDDYWKKITYFKLRFTKDEAGDIGPGDTIAQPENTEQFSFAIIGDTQNFYWPDSIGGFKKAVTAIAVKNPNLVMTEGDLIQGCDDKQECSAYKLWKNIAKPILSKTYEVMGNHDRTGKNVSDVEWQNYFKLPTNGPQGYKELVYSFDYGNSHFVVLDSENPEHEIDKIQQQWLENDLSKNQKEDTFVFFHEPAFPMSYKIGSSLDYHSGYRDSLWNILDKYNVTAVFNGHEHMYSREKIDSSFFPGAQNSIYQIVIGNTDANEYKKVSIASNVEYYHYNDYNYLIVSVNGKQITVDLYSAISGTLVNSFTFSK